MIRINLLAEGKKPAVARRTAKSGGGGLGLGTQDLGQIALLGIIFLALLVGAGYWWKLRGDIKDLEKAIDIAQAEVDELAPIIKEVEEYKAKKAELEHKIQVIQDLKANQRGPVRVMDEISSALPELLWLRRVKMTASIIEIDGFSFNNNAIAAFTENLDRVPQFQEEPDFKETVRDRNRSTDLYRFKINLRYRLLPISQGEESLETEAAAGGA